MKIDGFGPVARGIARRLTQVASLREESGRGLLSLAGDLALWCKKGRRKKNGRMGSR